MTNSFGRRRAIFLDVDGTILEHEIVDPTAPPAMAAARANGHLVFICTGRSFNGIDQAVLELPHDGVVSSGGASARVGGIVVHQSTMGAAKAQQLIDYFTNKDIPFKAEADDGVYCTAAVKQSYEEFFRQRKKEHTAKLAELGMPSDNSEHERFPHFQPIERMNIDTVSKLTFMSQDASTYEDVLNQFGDAYHLVPGSTPVPGGSSGEIAAPGITKATGIAAVLDCVGITPANAVGIGDSWNDREMFELCGVSVAMGNAPDELKEVADLVTSPVLHGGVHNALQTLELI